MRSLRDHGGMPSASSPYPAAFPPDPDQIVTSSNLVRHFGAWQERAARDPVYVLLHGRPRLVLLAIETFATLCAAAIRDTDTIGSCDVGPLLDTIGDIVLIADGAGRITTTSRAARLHFGSMAAPGQPLADIAPLAQHPALGAAIRRVTASGTEEGLHVRSIARTGRVLAVTLIPFRRGVALIGRDESLVQEHARLCAIEQAAAEAMTATGDSAGVLIDRSGTIVDPAPALTVMLGTGADMLRSTSFPALAILPQRAAVARTIERVFTSHRTEAIDTVLGLSGQQSKKVRIGFAPVWHGGAIDHIVGIICAR